MTIEKRLLKSKVIALIESGERNQDEIARKTGAPKQFIYYVAYVSDLPLDKKSKRTEDTINKAREQGAKTISEIAEKTGLRYSTVQHTLKKMGIKPQRQISKTSKIYQNQEEVNYLLKHSSLSYREIAKKVNITAQHIHQHAQRTGLAQQRNERIKKEKQERKKQEQLERDLQKQDKIIKELNLEGRIDSEDHIRIIRYIMSVGNFGAFIGCEKVRNLYFEHNKLMNNEERYTIGKVAERAGVEYQTAVKTIRKIFGWFPSEQKKRK